MPVLDPRAGALFQKQIDDVMVPRAGCMMQGRAAFARIGTRPKICALLQKLQRTHSGLRC